MISVGFFAKLQEINNNRDNLNKKILEAVEKFIEKNNKFTEDEVKKASVAAHTLFVWINALLDYSKTVEKIEPLRKEVEAKNIEYAKAQALLKEKLDILAVVEGKVANLENKLRDANNEKNRLDDQIDLTQQRLV